ncbi:MAG: enoyl-CoA hydratase-related protein [Balneolales bacterium]
MLKVERTGRVCRLVLNRPEKRNALSGDLVDELQLRFDEAFDDDGVKVIVLAAEGGVFCAGADLATLDRLQSATYEENVADSGKLARLFLTIRNGGKAVLAAIHGHAIAGGCGLAGVCDISVAVKSAQFGYTESRIGFVPAIVTKFLLEKVGETQTKKLLLTGRLITAAEAERIGLITEAVADEEFDQTIEKWVHTLVSKVSGESVAQTKTLINKVADLSVSKAVSEAVQVNALSRSTSDCRKGVRAFLNKENIDW